MSTALRTPMSEHAPQGFLSWVAALVHAHRAHLLASARRAGLAADDALDAVQDAFVSFMALPQARDIAHVNDDALKLLSVMVKHSVLNRLRKGHRRRRAQVRLEFDPQLATAESSEQLIERAEEVGRIRGCIVRMAQLQRRVVMLSLLDGEDHETIAAQLEVTVGYVRVLLHRARAHLRACDFDEELPVEGAR